jgi:4-hydroxybenzoate polyprenyltransferase
MIKAINNFYASKRNGLLMALLATFLALFATANFLPVIIRHDLRALTIGFAVGLSGFSRAYSEDVKRNGPIGKEILTRSFYVVSAFFILILLTDVVRDIYRDFKS